MSYPSIKDDNFSDKINKKYKNYIIPKKKKTFEQICFPKEFEFQIPQKFLADYMSPNSPYKGLLIFHKIGAGKTCTGVNICEQWKGLRKLIVVVPASLIGNFRNELRSMCAKNSYLKDKERKELKNLHPSSVEYKKIIEKSDGRIDKYYKIYSYNKFIKLIEEGKLNFNNTLLMIDEVQNMVSMDGKYYKVLYEAIQNAPSNLRVVLLSATPMFDKPVEIALTMNLLRLPVEFPIGKEFDKVFLKCPEEKITGCKAKNLDMFKNMIKGYVSYFRGAPPYVFPESKIKYVKCEMSEFQYRSYLTVLAKEEEKSKGIKKLRAFLTGEILELPNNFFIGTRIISNIAFPNRGINEDGYESFKGAALNLDNLQNYSIKFYKILKKIKSGFGPIFVYSNFKEYGGIKSFVKVLEANGYKNYVKHGEGTKRFAVWTGSEDNETREEIKAVFNQQSNYNGTKLKIVLGSPSTKEGISWMNVQQIHILEPYWNYSRILQIIGRGVRYCSHKNLPEEKRQVKVYIYIATHPYEEVTIDQYIMNLALKKNKLIQQFETALKEAAIDCTLFKNANVFKDQGEPDIKCIL